MRIDHAQIERRQKQIRVRESDEHGPVDSGITCESAHIGLDCHSSVSANVRERRIGEIELRDPSDKLRGSGGGGGDVAVVGADGFSGSLPGEIHFSAWVAERDGSVVGDRWAAVFSDHLGVETFLAHGDVG